MGRRDPGLLFASRGTGPLLERDYWAVLKGCAHSPSELMEVVARRFCDLPPPELVRFAVVDGKDASLQPGDLLEVQIRGAGRFHVRVVHKDDNSFTIATLPRHPEAGRITFGAYRSSRGDVVFHIRSRARSSSRTRLWAFVVGGEAMQTNTWTDFIANLAHLIGEGIIGPIWAETREVDEEPQDRGEVFAPTYIARGD